MTPHEVAFESMGTRVRLLASDPAPLPAARAEVERLAALLTRFDPASELSRLNADPRPVVPASPDLRAAVAAAVAGAAATGGLCDPTLLGALERAGYDRTLTGRPRAPLAAALAGAPPPRAAAANPDARWRLVRIDDDKRTIARPPGLRLDLGGSAKGFIADRVAAMLAHAGPCAADIGGDLRTHGEHPIHVRDPFTRATAATLTIDGGIATSGIDSRLWNADRRLGAERHHLLDPSTNQPAWTGVVAATAKAPTAAEAEALAKAALLAGPSQGRALLQDHHGGLLVTDDGTLLVASGMTGRLAA